MYAVFAIVNRYGSRDEVVGRRAHQVSMAYETEGMAQYIAARDHLDAECEDVWIVVNETDDPFGWKRQRRERDAWSKQMAELEADNDIPF